MPVSEARLLANRRNSAKSTGPRTAEGKENSRRNGVKHGLSGAGVVVDSADSSEVEARTVALEAEFRPRSPLGQILVRQMAWLSVRMERSAGQELACLASRARNAVEVFDAERVEEAERLFEGLSDEPRRNLRKLQKSPEGVQRLVDAWGELLEDLEQRPKPIWTATHLETAANLEGIRSVVARNSRVGALSRALWGDFELLDEADGGDLDEVDRQAWAKEQLAERIRREIGDLEAHFDTLDHDTIELDRAEAAARSQFDPSREASLARRYEAEAARGFFKALNELRQAEAEFLEALEAPPEPATVEADQALASSRAPGPPTAREPLTTPRPPRRDRLEPEKTAETPRLEVDRETSALALDQKE